MIAGPLSCHIPRRYAHDHTLIRCPPHRPASPSIHSRRESADNSLMKASLRAPLTVGTHRESIVARLRERALRNADALGARGIDLTDAAGRWEARLVGIETRPAEEGSPEGAWRISSGGGWRGTGEERRAVEEYPLPYLSARGEVDPARPPKPIVVEGVAGPELLLRVWRTTPGMPDGYRPAIHVVQEDPLELMEGLACDDLRDVIADERVHWHVGAGAGARLGAWLEARLGCALPAEYLASPGVRTRAVPGVVDVVKALHAKQQAEHTRLVQTVAEGYAGRDEAWWRRRWDEAQSGGPPLRVLIPISRYSTFVRHAAADLAESLAAIGCEARVLTEPNDSSRLVTLAYLREFAQWTPDCVVLINYARRHMGEAVPANIPFVTWVQDRMAQLFDDAVGKSMGRLDFVVGHLHRELFDIHGYPKARRSFWFVPASARKFRNGPMDGVLMERMACDVAYVGHQSETPEAGHSRLRAAFALQPVLLRVVDRLFEEMRAHARATAEVFRGPNSFIIPLLKEALGREPEDRLVNAIAGNYAVPMAERLHRHATLQWAAEVARRRGWRFHLYGIGWDRHPEFAGFARGPLGHDDALCACYRSAAAHLHISRNTNAHQRVYECALAGGLMLRRGPSPDADMAWWGLVALLFESRTPAVRTPWGDCFFDLVEGEFPDPVLFAGASRRRIGTDGRGRALWRVRVHECWARVMNERRPPTRLEMLPDQAFPFAAETMFASPEELEARLARAVEDPAWREEVAQEQGEWVKGHASSDAFAAGLVRLVSECLKGGRAGLQGGVGVGR